jgi:hypothetical protein
MGTVPGTVPERAAPRAVVSLETSASADSSRTYRPRHGDCPRDSPPPWAPRIRAPRRAEFTRDRSLPARAARRARGRPVARPTAWRSRLGLVRRMVRGRRSLHVQHPHRVQHRTLRAAGCGRRARLRGAASATFSGGYGNRRRGRSDARRGRVPQPRPSALSRGRRPVHPRRRARRHVGRVRRDGSGSLARCGSRRFWRGYSRVRRRSSGQPPLMSWRTPFALSAAAEDFSHVLYLLAHRVRPPDCSPFWIYP